MAEFSKQWCETYDTGGMPWDFDIEEIASKLPPNCYIPLICEGFGFSAIGKSEEGVTEVFVTDYSTGEGKWHDYEDFLISFKNK